MKKSILSILVLFVAVVLTIKTNTLKADSTVTLTEGASIRLDDPAGLRFQAKVTEPVEGAKYGIVFANGEVAKENLDVNTTGAVYAEATELNSDNTYSVSMVKIPERAYFSDITARAYILIDNEYIYSDNIVTRNINEVARMWKKNHQDDENTFINEVLSIAKLNINGGTTKYENHAAMVEDFLNDFNIYSGKTGVTVDNLYNGSYYENFFDNVEMHTKWSWILELFISLANQGYGNHAEAKTQYENLLNGKSIDRSYYIGQSMQSLMTLSKCTSYNEESAIDFSLYKVSSQIESAINGGVELVNINLLPIPYRNGYTFKGWYDENDNLVTTLSEGQELTAKWDTTKYNITYNLNGGSLPEDVATTYTIEGYILPTPTNGTKQFFCWCDNAELTGDCITRIKPGTKGNIELYAKWIDDKSNYQLEIDAAYDLTQSTLDLPKTVTIDNKTLEVTWNTTQFIEKQIGIQTLLGTFTDSLSNQLYSIEIKVNVLPYVFTPYENAKEGVSGYLITNYYGSSKAVIPSTYREKEVIVGNAFANCTELTSVVITEGITTIVSNAFSGCSNLTDLTLSSSIKTIGESVFANCNKLENIYYDGTIEDWCNITFSSSSSNPMDYAKHFYMKDSNNEYKEVTEIVIPDTVTSIGRYQFSGLSSLKSVTISSSVKTILNFAFQDCNNLTIVIIAEGLTIINQSAFANCEKLESINLPSTLTTIGQSAFNNCSSLTSIIIPLSVTSIQQRAFNKCTNLIIYCEASSKPAKWATGWSANGPKKVVWGYSNN